MLIYELRKTLNRRALFLLLITVILCGLTVWLSVTPPPVSAVELEDCYALYENDPAEFDRRYFGYDLADLHALSHNPELYALNRVARQRNYIENHKSVLGRVIFQAEAGGLEASSAYMQSYHRQVAQRYTDLRDSVELQMRPVMGWEDYLSSPIPLYFALFAALFLAADQLLCESESKMLPVIRTCQNGRRETAFRKMLAIFLFSAVGVCLFSMEALAVSALKAPFAGGSAPIQLLPAFELSPMRLSIVGYALFQLIFRILAVFSAALLTSVIVQKILSRAIPILLVAGVFLLGWQVYQNSANINNNPLFYMNPYTVAFTNEFAVRYFSFNFFGLSLDGPVCVLVFFVLLCAALIGLSVLLFCRGGRVLQIRKPSRQIIRPGRRGFPYRSFLSWEFRKNLGLPVLLILAILLAGKATVLRQQLSEPVYADEAYRYYMNRLAGEVTPEKLDFILEERMRIDEILAKKDSVSMAYRMDEISDEDYRAFMDDYWEAYILSDGLARIEVTVPNLTEAENAHFVYESGYQKLFTDGADLFLCCSVFLIAYDLFLREKRTGMDSLLHTMKRGRAYCFAMKLIVCAVCTVCLCALYFGTDLMLTARAFELPDQSAVLVSLSDFAGIASGISIGGYLILSLAAKVIAYLIFAVICTLLFLLLRNFAAAGGTLLLLFFLPGLLREPVPAFAYVDYATLFSFSERVRLSGGVIGALLALAAVLAAAGVLVYASKQKYCR